MPDLWVCGQEDSAGDDGWSTARAAPQRGHPGVHCGSLPRGSTLAHAPAIAGHSHSRPETRDRSPAHLPERPRLPCRTRAAVGGRRRKTAGEAARWRRRTESAAFSLTGLAVQEGRTRQVGAQVQPVPAARAGNSLRPAVRSIVTAGTCCRTAVRAASRRGAVQSRSPRGTRCRLRRGGGRNRRRQEWRLLPAPAPGTVSPQMTSPVQSPVLAEDVRAEFASGQMRDQMSPVHQRAV